MLENKKYEKYEKIKNLTFKSEVVKYDFDGTNYEISI
jgi:hypothetical protein